MSKLKLLVFIFCFFQFITAGNIKGKITVEGTSFPLAGANIFLSGSTIGTAAAKDGSYIVRNIPPGKYTIVYSMIGYERKFFDVQIAKHHTLEMDVELAEKVYETDNVEVTSLTAYRWKLAYRIFKRQFFGENRYAFDCRIHNKNVLNFRYDGRTLIAETDSVLKVTNEALGYDIDVEFDQFIYDPVKKIVVFNIFTHFKEIEMDEDDQEDVEENRREVYLGSFKHLLSELAVNDTTKFSFEMKKTAKFDPHYTEWKKSKLFDFGAKMFQDSIYYSIESDSSFMAIYDDDDIRKEGIIYAKSPQLIFDSFGNILNGNSFIAFGDWKSQRFSMQLPRNFKIDLYKKK